MSNVTRRMTSALMALSLVPAAAAAAGAAAPASLCAFSAGSPAATRARIATLLDRLARHPVTVAGTTYTQAVALDTVVGGFTTRCRYRTWRADGPTWPTNALPFAG